MTDVCLNFFAALYRYTVSNDGAMPQPPSGALLVYA